MEQDLKLAKELLLTGGGTAVPGDGGEGSRVKVTLKRPQWTVFRNRLAGAFECWRPAGGLGRRI